MVEAIERWLSGVEIGSVLGGYHIKETLGRGWYGTTYRVLNRNLGKEFALKSFVVDERISLEWLDLWDVQMALLGRLSHVNVDQVINSGRDGALCFCIKDFVHDSEGNNCCLRRYLGAHGGGRLSHFEVWHIVKQVLAALDYAYHYEDGRHRGLCHGNLKPENILLAESVGSLPFEVKLTDFQPYGLANSSLIIGAFANRIALLRQRDDVSFGDLIAPMLVSIYQAYDYLPPERRTAWDKIKPNIRGDIFALGVIIYEMLTGLLPCGRFAMPSELRDDIPSYWDDVIRGCLQYRQEQRFQTPDDILEAIGEINTSTEEEPKVVQKPRERLSLTPPGKVYIPAGTYEVGHLECGDDALPVYECTTEGFYIDRTPVTNMQFRRFVEATGYITDAEQEGVGGAFWTGDEWQKMEGINWRNPLGEELPEDFDDHPVVQVTYNDALAYAEWVGGRLPTEQEWEYAAKGGLKDAKFPWGNNITRSQANFSSEATTKVMRYSANGYGIYDVAGNVWEWTASWYQPYPDNTKESPHYGEKYKVVRGGAWLYDGAHCMVSYRNANDPTYGYPTIGFRTVSDFKQSKNEK